MAVAAEFVFERIWQRPIRSSSLCDFSNEKDRLSAITDHFFDTLVVDNNPWRRLTRFREVTFLAVTPEKLLAHMRTHMARSLVGSEKELFLDEAALSMAFSMDGPQADAAFE